jgi:hypothetical protein
MCYPARYRVTSSPNPISEPYSDLPLHTLQIKGQTKEMVLVVCYPNLTNHCPLIFKSTLSSNKMDRQHASSSPKDPLGEVMTTMKRCERKVPCPLSGIGYGGCSLARATSFCQIHVTSSIRECASRSSRLCHFPSSSLLSRQLFIVSSLMLN